MGFVSSFLFFNANIHGEQLHVVHHQFSHSAGQSDLGPGRASECDVPAVGEDVPHLEGDIEQVALFDGLRHVVLDVLDLAFLLVIPQRTDVAREFAPCRFIRGNRVFGCLPGLLALHQFVAPRVYPT